MKLFTNTLIFLLLTTLFLASCGSSGSEQQRFYSFDAQSFELLENEEGTFVVLNGISENVEFSYPGNSGNRVTGNFSTQTFADWWDHPSFDERLSLTTEAITIDLPDRNKKFVVANPHNFAYDSDKSELSIQVVLIGVESKRIQSRSNSSGASVKVKSISLNPSPAACGRQTPPNIPGLEFKWEIPGMMSYNDQGSRAHKNLMIFTFLTFESTGYYYLGDVAAQTYDPEMICGDFLLKDVSSEQNLVKPANRATFVWNDSHSGAKLNLGLWAPLTDNKDYTCLGTFSKSSHQPPGAAELSRIGCIKNSLLEPDKNPAPLIWNDRGSGAKYDVTLFRRGKPSDPNILGPFVAVPGYPDTAPQFLQFKRP